jgi:hypothetical protein
VGSGNRRTQTSVWTLGYSNDASAQPAARRDPPVQQCRQQNPNQTPSRDIEMQGELYVARSPRHRIRSLPIPAELRAAMADLNMFTRLGAVTEWHCCVVGKWARSACYRGIFRERG